MKADNRHIVFDWNGTLLDDTHAVFDSTNVMLSSLKQSAISRDDFHKHYSVPLEDFYFNIGISNADVKRGAARDVFHDYYESVVEQTDLREGVRDILARIHEAGILSIILSNHILEPIKNQLRRLNVMHFFSEILAYESREIQFRDKTKAQRLSLYIEQGCLEPQNIMIVGDSLEEIQIAHEFGLTSVAITGGCYTEDRLRKENPDFLIHTMNDLEKVLRLKGFFA